jgi:hypothetical protein
LTIQFNLVSVTAGSLTLTTVTFEQDETTTFTTGHSAFFSSFLYTITISHSQLSPTNYFLFFSLFLDKTDKSTNLFSVENAQSVRLKDEPEEEKRYSSPIVEPNEREMSVKVNKTEFER